jgi:WD40 repeat protein
MLRCGCLFALLALVAPARAADLPPGAALRLGDARFRAGGAVAELVFSADGTELVSHVPGPDGDRVTVWDATTGEQLRTGVPPRTAGARVRWGASAVPGTDLGVVIGPDGTAVVRDFAAKQDRAKLAGHAARVTAVAASPDGRRLATASADGLIRTWDARTFRPLSTPSGHLGPVRTVEVSPDGRLALTVGADRSARVWDIATGREVRAYPLEEGGAAVFTPDGANVKIRTADRVLTRDLLTGLETARYDPPHVDLFTGPRMLSNACMALSPDGRVLALGRTGGEIDLIETATLGVRRQLAGPGPQCRDAVFTPDGSRLLTAGPGEGVLVWPVRIRDLPLTAELKRETSAAKLWDRLASPDAPTAYAALARLAADPIAAAKMARLRLGDATDPLAEARAVELLEALNTADARVLLREMADGGGRSAARALARLGEQHPPPGDIRTTGGTVP